MTTPRPPAVVLLSGGLDSSSVFCQAETLRRAGFDVCVSVAPEHHYYLAGYDAWVGVNSPQALVFAASGGEPALVLRNVDVPLARETAWVEDIRSYHLHADDVAGTRWRGRWRRRRR